MSKFLTNLSSQAAQASLHNERRKRMAKIVLKSTYVSDECETCGLNFASGFDVTIDGEPFGDYEAIATCFGSSSHEASAVLKDILEHFGHTVEGDCV